MRKTEDDFKDVSFVYTELEQGFTLLGFNDGKMEIELLDKTLVINKDVARDIYNKLKEVFDK